MLITHEVLQYLKTSKAQKRCTMAIKTDMSKAYDMVEWNFIKQVFERLGFHDKWTNLIMQCLTTVSYSYLINETAQGYVKPERGIRQGDPISISIYSMRGGFIWFMYKGRQKGYLAGHQSHKRKS